MILAMLFQGSRVSSFYCTLSSSLCQGGPKYWSRHLQLFYWFRNLDIRAKTAEATTSIRACQEDNEVLCLHTGPWVPWLCVPGSQHKYFCDSPMSVFHSALVVQCCGFLWILGNCHFIGNSSREQASCSILKDMLKKDRQGESLLPTPASLLVLGFVACFVL